MKNRALSLATLCFVFVLCLTIPAAASTVAGTFQRSLSVNGPVDLEVLTHSGDVHVHAGSSGSVAISAKIYVGNRWFTSDRRADVAEVEKNPPIRQSGNTIRIDYPNIHDLAIDYDVTVPAETTVRVHSGSGDQTIDGIRGAVTLEAGSGDIRLSDVQSQMRVHTGSGNVTAENVSGGFTAECGSGDVEVEEKGSGDVQMHTGSGNVHARGVRGALRAEAGSGDVTVEGQQTGGWEVRTGSGNVDIRVPQDSAFDLDASTSSGSLVVDHPVTMTIQGNVEHEKRTARGKVRGGGPSMMVHTGSGDIHIG